MFICYVCYQISCRQYAEIQIEMILMEWHAMACSEVEIIDSFGFYFLKLL